MFIITFYVIILSNIVNEGPHKIVIDEPEHYKILFLVIEISVIPCFIMAVLAYCWSPD